MGILWGPPGSATLKRGVGSWQLTPSPARPPLAVDISMKNECFAGSSSTEGHQTCENNGALTQAPAWYINKWKSEASLKQVKNYGLGGGFIETIMDFELGNATYTAPTNDASGSGAIVGGDGNENWTIQCDTNSGGIDPWLAPGCADTHYSALKGTGNYTAGSAHKGIFAQLNALVASEKRFVAWTYNDISQGGYGVGHFCSARFHRLVWAQWPGCGVDEPRYWSWVPPTPNDYDPNGYATVSKFMDDYSARVIEDARLPSFQKADRSHMNPRGYSMIAAAWQLDAVEARQGGMPWFPDHRYYVDTVTARTNGGAVCTLGFQGSLTGVSLSLIDCATGQTSPDFAIDASANVTRIGTGGTAITKDLIVACRIGDHIRWYHVEIGVSQGTISRLAHVDGNFGLTMYSSANTGTTDAPVYASAATCLAFGGGVQNAAPEGSFMFAFNPDLDQDANSLFLMYANGGAQVSRMTTGAVRFALRDHLGTAFGQLTSGAVARNANGLVYVGYSFSIPNTRHQLVVYNDVLGTASYSSGVVTPSGVPADGCLNPQAAPGGSQRCVSLLSGASTGVVVTPFKGFAGPTWFAEKEIDFISGGTYQNFSLFRAGVGSFVDLGASGVVTPLVGANVGTPITPYVFFNGDANELTDGNNRGYGGQFENWQRRDWRKINFLQGQPTN